MPQTLPDINPSQDRHVLATTARIIAERCVELLPDDDRAILRFVEADRPSTVRKLAAFYSLSPGTVSRRIRRIQRRVHHPVVVSLAKRGHTLSDRNFSIARALFAAGQPVRTVARVLAVEEREIRAIRQYLICWSLSNPRSPARIPG